MSKSDKMFPAINGLLLILAALTMVAPLVHLLAVSLSDPVYANAMLVTLWPKGLQLDTYREIFALDQLWRSFAVTVYLCIMGTFVFLLFTTSMAYGLSRPMTPKRTWILKGLLITLVFSSPLIPNYMLVRSLGMENTLWALIIPGAMGTFGVIIMKTFFQGISSELFDVAKIDGCSEYGIYARMALPLSMPVIATLSLFHIVGLWNSYFSAIIFIRDKDLFPLQVVLRNLLITGNVQSEVGIAGGTIDIGTPVTPEQLKAGIIMVATLPILCVYPFLQKYFVKGSMLGSLKE
ncbi:carbohydrate ABC transporter permease [Paenibacillus nasutitermitis]|uniref:ABC transporter permease protein YtcP n=1 Tax=Paenibacillus nasutitermitis TaxID=1652958 RepID=A0A917DRA3_9BACL|nr:carbohydrate ABC transporter permease [Paenibacillus nasutitermitis]GGD59148.1 putative ABC transporter permease protein YtcP [Paenibacillus nasutitermitis]